MFAAYPIVHKGLPGVLQLLHKPDKAENKDEVSHQFVPFGARTALSFSDQQHPSSGCGHSKPLLVFSSPLPAHNNH